MREFPTPCLEVPNANCMLPAMASNCSLSYSSPIGIFLDFPQRRFENLPIQKLRTVAMARRDAIHQPRASSASSHQRPLPFDDLTSTFACFSRNLIVAAKSSLASPSATHRE